MFGFPSPVSIARTLARGLPAAVCLMLTVPASAQVPLAEVQPPPRLAELAPRAGYTVLEVIGPSGPIASAPGTSARTPDRDEASRTICTEARDRAPTAADRADADAESRSGSSREPAVRCSIFHTEGGRIEELRVRGQVQRVRVQPPGQARAYEIQLLDAGRDAAAKSGPGRGAEGQRVWPVLAF